MNEKEVSMRLQSRTKSLAHAVIMKFQLTNLWFGC